MNIWSINSRLKRNIKVFLIHVTFTSLAVGVITGVMVLVALGVKYLLYNFPLGLIPYVTTILILIAAWKTALSRVDQLYVAPSFSLFLKNI